MGGSLSQVGTKDRDPATVLVPCGAGSSPAQTKESMTRFYTKQHRFYAGIDLHARTLQSGRMAVIRLTPEDESVGAVVWRSSDRSASNDPKN